MSLLGFVLANWLKHRYGSTAQDYEGYAVGAALVAGGIGFLAKGLIRRGVQASDAPFVLARRDKIVATTIGAVFGFVVGLTSVGSGTFFGLVMVLVYPLTLPKIVGTDIFHAAALLWVAGIGHLVSGNVDLHATMWLLFGSIPGVLIASQFTVRMPDRALRLALATVLVLSGVKLLDPPEVNTILASGLGAGAAALVVYAFRAWLRRPKPAPAF